MTIDFQALTKKLEAYECVIVPEGPLGDALEARVSAPRLGEWVNTPRRWARSFFRTEGKSEKYSKELAEELGQLLGLERVAAQSFILYFSKELDESAEFEQSLTKTLEHFRLEPEPTSIKDLSAWLKESQSLTYLLDKKHFSSINKGLIIESVAYSTLERQSFPDSFERYTLSTGIAKKGQEQLVLEIFADDLQLLKALQTSILHSKPQELAVGLPTSHPIYPELTAWCEQQYQAELKPKKITELPETILFLEFLSLLQVGEAAKAKDFYLLGFKDFKKDKKIERKKLSELKGEKVWGELLSLPGSKLSFVFDYFNRQASVTISSIFLDFISSYEEAILTKKLTQALRLELKLSEQTQAASREQVLFFDPTQTGIVDRPKLILVGPDAHWEVPVAETVDKTYKAIACQQERLEHLLHLKPSLYISALSQGKPWCWPESIKSLKHLAEKIKKSFKNENYQTRVKKSKSLSHQKLSALTLPKTKPEMKSVDKLSASRLSSYVTCPHRLYLDKMLGQEESEALTLGRLVHDLAELHVQGFSIEEEDLVKQARHLLAKELDETATERALVKLHAIHKILPIVVDYLKKAYGKYSASLKLISFMASKEENVFASSLDLNFIRKNTEVAFVNEEALTQGKIDWMLSPQLLIDWKTGKARSKPEFYRQCRYHYYMDKEQGLAEEETEDTAADEEKGIYLDFQSLLYLEALWQAGASNHEKQEIVFVYFKDLMTSGFLELEENDQAKALEKSTTKVSLWNIEFEDWLVSHSELYKRKCDDKHLPSLAEVLAENLSLWFNKEKTESVRQDLLRYLTNYKDQDLTSLLDKLNSIAGKYSGRPRLDAVHLFPHDYRRFQQDRAQWHQALNNKEFPIKPFQVSTCKRCRHLSYCPQKKGGTA